MPATPLPPCADYVGQHVPRVLINREKAGELTSMKRALGYTRGFDWDPATNYRCAAAAGHQCCGRRDGDAAARRPRISS